MPVTHPLARLRPDGLDPELWRAVLALAGPLAGQGRDGDGHGDGDGWEVSVAWEETPAAFAEVAGFFRDEQTAFPRLPLGSMDWALDAEERCAARWRLGRRGRAERLDDDEDLRAPWLAIYLVTAEGAPDRALVGTVRRGLSARAEDAIDRVLQAIQRVPLVSDLAVSLATEAADRERSALFARERDGVWTLDEPIRGC